MTDDMERIIRETALRVATEESERIAAVLSLTAPLIEHGKGKIGTHSDRCHEHHAGCLAHRVADILNGGNA